MSKSKKILVVTMPDESRWAVAAEVIAHDRAKYYDGREPGCYDQEFSFTMENDDEITDWAANNMNWNDVKHVAHLYEKAPAVDYQEGWLNGQQEVRNTPTRLKDLAVRP